MWEAEPPCPFCEEASDKCHCDDSPLYKVLND